MRAAALLAVVALLGCHRNPRRQSPDGGARPLPVPSRPRPHGTPIQIATMPRGPGLIALGGLGLYWLTEDSNREESALVRVDREGKAPIHLFGPVPLDAFSLAVGDDEVFVGGGSRTGITAFVRDGGTPRQLLPADQTARGLAVDGRDLYFEPNVLGIARVALSGGPAVTLLDGTWQLSDLELDDDAIYYIRAVSMRGSSVMKRSKTGVESVVFDQQDAGLGALGLDSDNLYWIREDADSNELWRQAKRGGAPRRLLREAGVSLGRPVADRDSVYLFRTRGPFENDLLAVDQRDGTVTVLASERDRPIGNLIQDDHALYYTRGFQGSLMKLVK